MELFKKDQYNDVIDKISLSSSDDNVELEAIFNPVSLKKKNNIDRITFENVVSRLKGLYKEEQQSEQLDIRCHYHGSGHSDKNNIRISIIGLEHISKYCKKNLINDSMHIDYIKKTKMSEPLDIDEYNVRINLKEEIVLDKEHAIITELNKDLKTLRKTFRLKKRVSYFTPDNLFRFDLTVVKEPDIDPNTGSYMSYLNFKESKILSKSEKYEIELEYIGGNIEEYNREEILERFIGYMCQVLQIIQKTDHIISRTEKQTVLNNYKKLIGTEDKLVWIGPQPVSLDMSSIRMYDDDNIPTITRNYSVTEKADGERHIMYINNEGKVYLLNNRWSVIDLGVYSVMLKNSLIDGEYVLKDKNGLYKPKYLAYDMYYYNNTDIRNKVLHTSDKDGRIDLLENILKNKDCLDYTNNELIDIRVKKFYYGNIECDNSIFDKCKTIVNWSKSDACDYETDGLIFTPINKKVGEEMNGKYNNNTGKTWNLCKKWKPPEDNTIDFMIKIVRNENNNQELINYNYKPGQEEPASKYKTLELYCGMGKHQKNKSCKDLLEGKIDYIGRYSKNEDDYFPTLFKPENPEDLTAYTCKLELSSDGRILTNKNEEILDGMIVEMSYNNNIDDSEWRWIPRNIRYDKTEKNKSGQKEFGNNINTANNIWKTIHNPITEHMITTGNNISSDNEEDKYYLGGVDRKNSMTKSMLDFHNIYIKRKMINGVCNELNDGTFLDLCCGRGGDINKWSYPNTEAYKRKNDNLPLSLVVGIDNVKDNINEACDRYIAKKTKEKGVPNALFIWGNASSNWSSCGMDKLNNDILETLWGKADDNKNVSDYIESLSGTCNNGFDAINCQFAIHYLFGNKEHFTTLINNIKSNLKNNGYFIGTCFDGNTIYNEFKDKNIKDYILWENKNHNPIWRIQKDYENIGDELPLDDRCLGMKINVFAETINQTLSENLVNFDYFEQEMNNENIYIISPEEAQSLGFPNGTGLFSEVYDSLSHDIKSKLNMDDKEKQFSFYNRYFIFKKQMKITKKKKKKIKIIKP